MKRFTVASRFGEAYASNLFVLVLTSLLFAGTVSAQTDQVSSSSSGLTYKPMSGKSDNCAECLCICIQGSLDFANLHETYGPTPGYPGGSSGYSSKIGFNAGVFASKGFMELGPGELGAMTGLEFIEKGGKNSTDHVGLNYIELPIDVIYSFPVMDDNSVFAGLGPYFAYGVGGKDKYNDGTSSSTEPSFGNPSTTYGLKRFDFGIQVLAGFKLSCMASLSLSYDFGLLDVANNDAIARGLCRL